MSDTNNTHESLRNGLQRFYATLVEMTYLESQDVRHPPHDIQRERLVAAGATTEVVDLVSSLPYIDNAAPFMANEGIKITPNSKAVSYLGREDFETLRGVFADDEQRIPSSALKIAESIQRVPNEASVFPRIMQTARNIYKVGLEIAYDVDKGQIVEWGRQDSSAMNWDSARRYDPKEYFDTCIEKIRSFQWLVWLGNTNDGINVEPTGYESHIATDPHLIANMRAFSQSRDSPHSPSFDRKMQNELEIHKADSNKYWGQRLIYEEAGWPDNFDADVFRSKITDPGIFGPNAANARNMEDGRGLREWVRSTAGSHAV